MTNKSTGSRKTRRDLRIELVQIIYQYELFNYEIDSNKIFETNNLGKFGTRIINSLEKNYLLIVNIYKKIISKNWVWERISP